MEHRLHQQLRAIRHYAKVMNLELEVAARQWCDSGLAERWARWY